MNLTLIITWTVANILKVAFSRQSRSL